MSPEYATTNPTEQLTRPRRARRWLAGGAVGVLLGVVLLGGTAFAQDDGTEDGLGESFIDRLAGKLGLAPDQLEATIKETQTEMVDEAVANGNLTEEQGERLKEQIAEADGAVFGHPHFGHHRPGFMARCVSFDAIADELGMTTSELRSALLDGATLEEIIAEQGSTVEAVVDAVVSEAEAMLAEAVANGRLTQERADEILAELPERLTELIENGFPGGPRQWFDGGDDATDDAEQTSASQV